MPQPILTHSYYSDFYAAKGYDFLKKVAQSYSTPDNLIIFSVMHCYEAPCLISMCWLNLPTN